MFLRSFGHLEKYVLIGFLQIQFVAAAAADAGQIRIEQQGQEGTVLVDAEAFSKKYDLKIRQSGIENMLDVGIASSSTVIANQHGDYGLVDLELRGEDDYIRIYQSGSFNSISGLFQGQSNHSQVDQSGHKNQISLNISGNSSVYRLTQSGIENKLSLSHNGYDERVDITQAGQQNTIEVDHSSSNIGLDVEQEGSGGFVRITN